MVRHTSSAGHHGLSIEWDAHPTLRLTAHATRFAAFVAEHENLDLIVHEACRVAVVGVRARFAGLLQFRMDQRAFVLKAAIGWHEPGVGCMRQAADLATTAGLAWHTGQLIKFRGLSPGGRVRALEPMAARGVCNLLSVPIRGEPDEGFGVLEVGSTETREFTQHDASFVRALAHILETALGQQAACPPT